MLYFFNFRFFLIPTLIVALTFFFSYSLNFSSYFYILIYSYFYPVIDYIISPDEETKFNLILFIIEENLHFLLPFIFKITIRLIKYLSHPNKAMSFSFLTYFGQLLFIFFDKLFNFIFYRFYSFFFFFQNRYINNLFYIIYLSFYYFFLFFFWGFFSLHYIIIFYFFYSKNYLNKKNEIY